MNTVIEVNILKDIISLMFYILDSIGCLIVMIKGN